MHPLQDDFMQPGWELAHPVSTMTPLQLGLAALSKNRVWSSSLLELGPSYQMYQPSHQSDCSESKLSCMDSQLVEFGCHNLKIVTDYVMKTYNYWLLYINRPSFPVQVSRPYFSARPLGVCENFCLGMRLCTQHLRIIRKGYPPTSPCPTLSADGELTKCVETFLCIAQYDITKVHFRVIWSGRAMSNIFLHRQQWCTQHFIFHQYCHYSSCLLCCVIHYCSTGWCCGTLLYCEEEMWLPEVLLSDNSPQAAATTASTSVWGHCWPVSEHWTEGECCIRSCAAVNLEFRLLPIWGDLMRYNV